MSIDRQSISVRLDELIQLAGTSSFEAIGEITSGTITILEKLYGADSEKMKAYVQLYQDYVRNPSKDSAMIRNGRILNSTMGVLKSIKSYASGQVHLFSHADFCIIAARGEQWQRQKRKQVEQYIGRSIYPNGLRVA